jgi:hypothetical protein
MFVPVPAMAAIGQRIHGDIERPCCRKPLRQDDVRSDHHKFSIMRHAATKRLQEHDNFVNEEVLQHVAKIDQLDIGPR